MNSTFKKLAIQSAIIAAVAACDAGMFRHRSQGVELPKHKPSEEEQARRIQAAEERRQRRNAKHKEKNDGNA